MATIEAIPCREEVVRIELPAAEMAIYRELEHHLLSLDENLFVLPLLDSVQSLADFLYQFEDSQSFQNTYWRSRGEIS